LDTQVNVFRVSLQVFGTEISAQTWPGKCECDTDDQDELATFLSPHSFFLYFSSTFSIFFPYLSLVTHRNVERRGGSIVDAGYGGLYPHPHARE
jgi:hypothetical protein